MAQTQTPLQTQAQPEEETLIDAQEVQFWLAKVVFWGQAESPDTQKDTCLHLSRLKGFLQLLLSHINNVSSTTEAMTKLPFLGQFLGRLCWNPCVTADAEGRSLLFQSMWCLYSEEPSNAVERKANQWIRNVLCQLATEEDGTAMQALVKHMGVPSTEYHLRVLRKTVGLLLREIGKSCSTLGTTNQRCSCDHVLAASQACIPLVTCPEAAPLIGALLQRPVTCVRETLCQNFLNAVSSAYSSQCLVLEEQALVSLWCHDLPSLEGAALSLVESALATPHNIEQQLSQSVLPKACSVHCSLFLVVNDIFRSILKQVEGSQALLSLLSSFTICFLRELTLLQSQGCMSLKAFFPNAPHKLLVPLLTQPSEMPREAWKDHLNWLSGSLQRLTQEEEEKGGEDGGARGQWAVFEAWFLLAQCAHWVEVAVQLLVSADPEDCGALLWLLTFYHHPTNRGHHRTLQLVAAREVWERLRSPFLVSTGIHQPSSYLQPLVELLSRTEQLSLAPLLILSLLVNFAVLSTVPLSGATEIVRTVVEQSSVVDEAVCVLSSMEFRLNGRGCLSTEANSIQFRIKALQEMLTHTQTSAENPTHTHL